ncbi:MAG: C39 family peptidase, partial [Lachnospiraceae bacterium]|nr:C39 family peptidase [Lachnospiraceae bacterium]
KVREGSPVIVWGAANISNEPVLSIEWIVDGEYLVWKTNLHCMVLIGYDTREKTVIVSDPMRGIKEYDMAAFIKRYKQFYSQAVVLD